MIVHNPDTSQAPLRPRRGSETPISVRSASGEGLLVDMRGQRKVKVPKCAPKVSQKLPSIVNGQLRQVEQDIPKARLSANKQIAEREFQIAKVRNGIKLFNGARRAIILTPW